MAKMVFRYVYGPCVVSISLFWPKKCGKWSCWSSMAHCGLEILSPFPSSFLKLRKMSCRNFIDNTFFLSLFRENICVLFIFFYCVGMCRVSSVACCFEQRHQSIMRRGEKRKGRHFCWPVLPYDVEKKPIYFTNEKVTSKNGVKSDRVSFLGKTSLLLLKDFGHFLVRKSGSADSVLPEMRALLGGRLLFVQVWLALIFG